MPVTPGFTVAYAAEVSPPIDRVEVIEGGGDIPHFGFLGRISSIALTLVRWSGSLLSIDGQDEATDQIEEAVETLENHSKVKKEIIGFLHGAGCTLSSGVYRTDYGANLH